MSGLRLARTVLTMPTNEQLKALRDIESAVTEALTQGVSFNDIVFEARSAADVYTEEHGVDPDVVNNQGYVPVDF